MSFVTFVRKLFLHHSLATEEETIRANTENAARENEKAFQEMHQTYSKVPVYNDRLKQSINRAKTTPFAELERMMHGDKWGKH